MALVGKGLIRINLEQFEEMLLNRSRSSPVTIVTETLLKMKKGGRLETPVNPYFENVLHICKSNVYIGANYENAVNRQRDRESQPLSVDASVEYFNSADLWHGKGEMANKFLARHKESGKVYLVYKPTLDADGHVKHMESVHILADTRKEIDLARLDTWLKSKSESEKQAVDKTVQWRTVELENVVQMVVDGKIYLIRS